jgi:HAD superfamily hydrolase (TIGR01459 family)
MKLRRQRAIDAAQPPCFKRAMTDFPRLGQLREHYDILYCDVWGVIRDGRALLPDAVEALRAFRRAGGAVCLVSNSPRRHTGLADMLVQMGLPGDATDAMVTSGDAIHAELAARMPGRAWHIGPDRDLGLYDGLDIAFTGVDEADFISCTGPDDYWNGRPEDYADRLSVALDRGLDLVCANPDIVVQAGDRLIFCAGAIARHYREMGGRSVVAGKPHKPIYDLARTALEAAGHPVDPARTLAIGDGPETDIAGAARIGVDALFIAEGILGADMESDGFDEKAVARALEGYGVSARWLAPRLVW